MKKHASFRVRLSALLLVLFGAAFLLLASRNGDARLYFLAAAVPGGMLLLLLFPSAVLPLDRPSLTVALVLSGFGILAPAAFLPEEAFSQGLRSLIALFFLIAGIVLIRAFRPTFPTAAAMSVFALGLLSVPLWFAELEISFTEGGTALLLIAVAAFLSLHLCFPAVIVSLLGLSLLLLQQDSFSSAICGSACILLFWAGSGTALWSAIELTAVAVLFGGWMVLSPAAADSSVDLLILRLANLSFFPPESIPESEVAEMDSILYLLGSQYGLIALICALSLLMLLLLRGTSLALSARKSFHADVSFSVSLLFGLRTFCFLMSACGLIPFAAGDFPFITDSLPSLCAQFFLVGLLSGVSSRNALDLTEDARLSMLAH